MEDMLALLDEGPAFVRLDYGAIRVAGLERADFLHNQCSSDIKKLPAGSWLETAFLNNKGQIEYAGAVLNLGEYLLVIAPNAAALAARFKHYIIFDQVEISLLQGQATWHSQGGTGCREENGVWAFAEQMAWGWNVEPVGQEVASEAWNVWRVEQGLVAEEALGHLPQEVGWDTRVSYKKGCYLGQEIMARLEARGNTRYKMVRFRAEQAFAGEATQEGKTVGQVAASVYSPRLGHIALGLVRKEVTGFVRVGGIDCRVETAPEITEIGQK
jgi:tRNA-modifying protein YgfZ